jgi:hypothetical protein
MKKKMIKGGLKAHYHHKSTYFFEELLNYIA